MSPLSPALSDSPDLSDSQRSSSGKARRMHSTAERRANHNAIERARRETLNGRFLDLAATLPSISHVKRPSKSMIVNKSIEYVQDTQAKMGALIADNAKLRQEVDELRNRVGMPPLPPPGYNNPLQGNITSLQNSNNNTSNLPLGFLGAMLPFQANPIQAPPPVCNQTSKPPTGIPQMPPTPSAFVGPSTISPSDSSLYADSSKSTAPDSTVKKSSDAEPELDAGDEGSTTTSASEPAEKSGTDSLNGNNNVIINNDLSAMLNMSAFGMRGAPNVATSMPWNPNDLISSLTSASNGNLGGGNAGQMPPNISVGFPGLPILSPEYLTMIQQQQQQQLAIIAAQAHATGQWNTFLSATGVGGMPNEITAGAGSGGNLFNSLPTTMNQ